MRLFFYANDTSIDLINWKNQLLTMIEALINGCWFGMRNDF